ncbi:MAG: 7-cyano-7-deazaguanine synthase QueC [FCB group bacterium]|nr:7-cyano-7-deazaguanine synthase QueC [FCB group bacterium]
MSISKPLAVVLVSGGMDSCVTAAIADHGGFQIAMLHMNYGQRTEKRELKAFLDLADYYQVNRKLVMDVTHLSAIGGSSLTDMNMDVPDGDLNNKDIPNTYVPFRNANILSAAVSWAEVLGADAIFIGAVEEDSSGYPDCRRSFYDAFEKAIDEGTRPETKIEIITPLINMTKMEIVLMGLDLEAPLELTWSCYQREDYPCGTCDSCRLRERGFTKAQSTDPLIRLRP